MPSRPVRPAVDTGAAPADVGGSGASGPLTPGQAALVAALDARVSPRGLRRALVHRSWAYENGPADTNERLEFLGDAVLQLAVTEELYQRHPEADEGLLSRMRIAVVSRPALAEVARALGVGEAMLLGRGEELTGGRDRDSLLADTLEALIGLVHVERGPEASREVVLRVMAPLLDTAHDVGVEHDHKTTLQVLAAERGMAPPRYALEQEGPPHDPRFRAEVRCGEDGQPLGAGEGRSKKVAEQQAAAAAVALLRAEA